MLLRNAAVPKGRTIATRLHWATAAAVAAIGLCLALTYGGESARIERDRIALLRSVVDTATSIAASYEAEQRSGRLSGEQARQQAARAIGAMRYLGSEYVWINDMHPTMVMHPIRPELNGQDLTAAADPNGKRLFVAAVDVVRADGAGVIDYLWPRPGSDDPVPKLSYVRGFAPWGWVIGSGVYVDDLSAERRRMALQRIALGLLAGLTVGAVIWWLGRGVARPLRELTSTTALLSEGQLTVAVPGLGRPDEFGRLARALEVLKEHSRERLRLEGSAAEERAVKDRRQAAMDQLTRDFGAVISAVLTRLSRAAETMVETSRTMSSGTETTRRSVTETASGSLLASRDLATVASATVELAAGVDEITRQVGLATNATREAVDRAAESDATFLRLADMAERIGDVGDAIAGIAAQTNLLALNATIEAARAGDAGKGFSVVAKEVKALAGQTARATVEIIQHVNAIKNQTRDTAASISEVNAAVDRVNSVATAIAAAIGQQGATTREISASVQNVAEIGGQTSSAMERVAAIANDTGAISASLLAASGDIASVAGTLRDEVNQFLNAMGREDGYKRLYERIPGNGHRATLTSRDGRRETGTIEDISAGGLRVRCSGHYEPGDPLAVILPGAREAVHARIVRTEGGAVAVALLQDDAAMAAIDRALAFVRAEGMRAAA